MENFSSGLGFKDGKGNLLMITEKSQKELGKIYKKIFSFTNLRFLPIFRRIEA